MYQVNIGKGKIRNNASIEATDAAKKKKATTELRKAAEVEGDEAGMAGRKRRRGDVITGENTGS